MSKLVACEGGVREVDADHTHRLRASDVFGKIVHENGFFRHPIDMRQTLKAFPVQLTSVGDYARRVFGAA